MTRSIKAQKGMSLVEATIILLVLMILTSVLAPSIYDFVVDAKMVKVKEDCEAIGISVMRLVRDIGPCLKFNGAGDCTSGNHVQVVYSAGTNAGWPTTGADSMERHFTTNDVQYALPAWRGAYLPSPIGPDPWGSAYAVNVGYLAPDDPAQCFIDTFCLSAGPNRRFETAFNGGSAGGVERGGDDFTYVIAGSTCSTGNQGDCPDCPPPPPPPPPPCDSSTDDCGGGHTIGYWKNHPDAAANYLPIYLGTQGGADAILVNNSTLATDILSQHNQYGSPSNGIVKLYAQLLAADLNILGGANGSSVATIVSSANAFINTHPSTAWGSLSAQNQAMVLSWHSALGAFNNSLDL